MGACGTDTVAGSVSGTVKGQTYAIKDAISASVAITGNTGTFHTAAILLANTSGMCADITANKQPPSVSVVSISLETVNGTTLNTPTMPGTFAIYQGSGTPPAMAATLSAKVYDATCKEVTTDTGTATTGTVTLTAISGNQFSGHYDVVMDSGDHITGSFDPEPCPALQTALDSTTPPACMN
ncbi:MAG: hypothetical protein ACM31C_13095 [Acidobacteriota bacterium]